MATLDPSVAAVRTAVRAALGAADLEPGLALVACSGGPDSLALAAATQFVAPRLGWRAGLLTVDHGLQPGSERIAARVAQWATRAGLSPVEVLPVRVDGRPGGPEAAARAARYQALALAAERLGATAVLLGHTRDDQAETVLLALARGAGPRGLAGMPPRRMPAGVAWLRPLLEISRAQTRAACAALGLEPWDDPHNTDPSYARVRVRAQALPALVAALGEGVVGNLAAPPGNSRPIPPPWTHSPPMRSPPRVPETVIGRRWRWQSWPGCPRRSGPGCCTPGRASWAYPAPPSPTGTWRRWTRWSPGGAARARHTCRPG